MLNLPLNVSLALLIIVIGIIYNVYQALRKKPATPPKHPQWPSVDMPPWANAWVYDHNTKEILPALFLEEEWWDEDGEIVPDDITQHWQEMYSPVGRATVIVCLMLMFGGAILVYFWGDKS